MRLILATALATLVQEDRATPVPEVLPILGLVGMPMRVPEDHVMLGLAAPAILAPAGPWMHALGGPWTGGSHRRWYGRVHSASRGCGGRRPGDGNVACSHA